MSDSNSPDRRQASINAWIILACLMVLSVVVYLPSLHGGYVFDDGYYFVDNTDVHVNTLNLGDWTRAALSQAGMNQFRALGMLSFAANYYFTGADPFWLKATNLAIHLLNGLVLFALLRSLFDLRALAHRVGGFLPRKETGIVTAVIAGAWLLLPINLTAVAYVSQRLEAIANLFVLLGLYAYLRARIRLYTDTGGSAMLWFGVAGCMFLGLASKESAALLPLYTFCVELAITGFRNEDGRRCKPALWMHLALLVLPFIAGLIWLSTWAFSGVTNFRQFSTLERLLTESRVLVDYIQWTLLPNLNALTFYHDDLAVSHGLLDPPTTMLAIAALFGLLGSAFWQRKARPLFCLGILWYFAGHSMTATVVPLELVFEHRNYFPSIGLLLAAASLIGVEPVFRTRLLVPVIAIAFLALCTFTTFLRAQEWSHPLRLAYSDALKRPDSARAQYTLAHALILASRDDDSKLITESIGILQREAARPNGGIAPLQALIYLYGRAHREIDPQWWQIMAQKLRDHAPSQTDIDSVIFLYHCQHDGDCPRQIPELLDVFTAALAKSQGNVNLMSAYGEFALVDLDDRVLAERMYRDAVAAKPQVATYRSNLVVFLIVTGQFDAAQTALAELRDLNKMGALDATIAELDSRLATARKASPQSIQNN
jgi:protein O-mannosyl-transferase